MGRIRSIIVDMWSIPELRRRLLFTLGMLLIWRLGIYVPLAGVDVSLVATLADQFNRQFMGFVNIFSGGAMSQASLFSLGIMPYISSSIIFQLLVKVSPTLEALSKEGPSGYRKINQYTRMATVPICIFQGIFVVRYAASMQIGNAFLVPDPGFFSFYLPGVLALTAGALFVMWLGEQVSEYGIGNGASLIIMSGIVDRMPRAVLDIGSNIDSYGLPNVLLLCLLYFGVVAGIVITTQAQRRIPVQHARHTRGRRVMGGQRTYLPLRVNQAGVMPVIFASSIMVVPAMLAQGLSSSTLMALIRPDSFVYAFIYVGMVFFFCYFWTALFFQPVEMSNQLKEYGSFVPGIRPGKHTADYLERIMNRVTLVGAAFLSVIALLPDVVSTSIGVAPYIAGFLGGTGILIVVGVGLDLMQKIESHLLMRQYEGFFRGPGGGRRLRGRR